MDCNGHGLLNSHLNTVANSTYSPAIPNDTLPKDVATALNFFFFEIPATTITL